MKKMLACRIAILLLILLGVVWLCLQGLTSKDGRKVQHPQCVNNLKMIGIAFRIWDSDHNGGGFIFNVSTNEGGTLELCVADKDGYDTNGFFHFKAMLGDDYIPTPRLLVCPQDKTRYWASGSTNFHPENLTYRLRTGRQIRLNGPRQVLVVCPVDGNILYTDGSVEQRNPNSHSDKIPTGQAVFSVSPADLQVPSVLFQTTSNAVPNEPPPVPKNSDYSLMTNYSLSPTSNSVPAK